MQQVQELHRLLLQLVQQRNLSSINVTNKSISITGISLAIGETADFRFTIGGGTANNAHIGVDDFTLYATSTLPVIPSITSSQTNLSGFNYFWERLFQPTNFYSFRK